MSTEKKNPQTPGFIAGKQYLFNEPIEAHCITYGKKGGFLKEKFSQGWCRNHVSDDVSIFIGESDSLDDKFIYYFLVEFKEGIGIVIESD